VSQSTNSCTVFATVELLPDAWQGFLAQGPVRAFNPALLRDGEGWLLAYRIVAADGMRRIGICRLDRSLRVIAGSALPLSDGIRFRTAVDYPPVVTHWFADPRLYRVGERVFLYWNSGWHEPRNYQFVHELDGRTLTPIGIARELLLRGERQKLEKNWTFFQPPGGADWFAVYSILPHRILGFSFAGESDIVFEPSNEVRWSILDYPAHHGGLRGGAPPFLAEGRFWTFCHSVHDGADGYRYLPAVYCFAAQYPFAPQTGPTRPLDWTLPDGGARRWPRLNPAVGPVIYPCGAAYDGTRWLITHGINDETCGLARLEMATVSATLASVRDGE
jgi:hypothetical protein